MSLIVTLQRRSTGSTRPAALGTTHVRFNLPDKDVFVIDATATTPALFPGAAGAFRGVGTDALQHDRQPPEREGLRHQHRGAERGAVRGHRRRSPDHRARSRCVDNRITVLDANGVHPRHLNKHINYDTCCAPIPNAENALSVSQPLAWRSAPTAQTLVRRRARHDKVVIYDTTELEQDTFVPSAARPDPRQRRRPDRARPRRAARPPVRADALRQRHLDHQHRTKQEIAHLDDAQSRAGQRRRRAALPLRRSAHVQPRRLVVRSCHVFGDKDELRGTSATRRRRDGPPDRSEVVCFAGAVPTSIR